MNEFRRLTIFSGELLKNAATLMAVKEIAGRLAFSITQYGKITRKNTPTSKY